MKTKTNIKLKIKKNDKVMITKGKDRSKVGKVIKCLPKENKVVIAKLNLYKKHKKPKKQGEVGQIVEIERPVQISNVNLVCSHCNKPTRIGYTFEKDKKVRLCKKCHKKID